MSGPIVNFDNYAADIKSKILDVKEHKLLYFCFQILNNPNVSKTLEFKKFQINFKQIPKNTFINYLILCNFQIPYEIVHEIIQYLDLNSLLQFRQTCQAAKYYCGEVFSKYSEEFYWDMFMKNLPKAECQFSIYSYYYEPDKQRKILFIFWAPETSTLRSKMLHAASTASLRKLFVGIDCEVQATDFEELQQEKINDKIYRILVQS